MILLNNIINFYAVYQLHVKHKLYTFPKNSV